MSYPMAATRDDTTMTYFDPEGGAALKSRFDELVLDWPGTTATTMFGCPSYQADGTLFAVLVTDGVALTRLPTADREQLVRAFDAGPFRAGDRTVTKWVQITVDGTEIGPLVPYIEASYESALAESD